MKTIKNIIALCLSFVILASIIPSVYSEYDPSVGFLDTTHGNSYPFTYRFMDSMFGYDKYGDWTEYYGPWLSNEFSWSWRNHEGEELDLYSSAWLRYYHFGDSEIWPQDFIGRFEGVLSKVDDGGEYAGKHKVIDYSWNGNVLTLNCGAEYDLEYRVYLEKDPGYGEVYVENCIGGYDVGVVVALVDKIDGGLINMATYYDGLGREYHYSYRRTQNPPEHTDGQTETVTDTGTIEVQMPKSFDPDKHEIAVYFLALPTDEGFLHMCDKCERDWCLYVDETNLFDPVVISAEGFEDKPPVPEAVRGDADGDGALNLSDVTATMKYLADWENITIDETAADTDGNGTVNLTDVSFMLQLIAGWNV